jgi:ATP-dependent Zn protease
VLNSDHPNIPKSCRIRFEGAGLPLPFCGEVWQRQKGNPLDNEAMHSDEEKAWHEAGHTVICILNGDTIHYVTIEPRGEKSAAHLSRTEHGDIFKSQDRLCESVRGLCAGAAVDQIRITEDDDDTADYHHTDIMDALAEWDDSTDWIQVEGKVKIILEMQGRGDPKEWDSEGEAPFGLLLMEIWRETVEILQAHWPTVEAIAKPLLDKRTLTGKQVRVIWDAIEGE